MVANRLSGSVTVVRMQLFGNSLYAAGHPDEDDDIDDDLAALNAAGTEADRG